MAAHTLQIVQADSQMMECDMDWRLVYAGVDAELKAAYREMRFRADNTAKKMDAMIEHFSQVSKAVREDNEKVQSILRPRQCCQTLKRISVGLAYLLGAAFLMTALLFTHEPGVTAQQFIQLSGGHSGR